MLKSFRSLPFLFTLISFPGFSATDYELAQRLIGQWSLTYEVPQLGKEPSSHSDTYTLSEIKEDPLHPGTYQVWGTNQLGEPVIAQYDSAKQEYRLAFAPHPTDPILYMPYDYYTLVWSSEQIVTGCYYQPDTLERDSAGTVTPKYGKCIPLSATVQPLIVRPVQRPVAHFTVTPHEGYGPLSIQLDATSSFDPDGGEIVNYEWRIYTFYSILPCKNFFTLSGSQVSFILPAPCSAEIELRVTDDEGFISTAHSKKGETPIKIRAFQSPHNQLPQIPGTPNYRLEQESLTLIFWRERQADGTYIPFIRIIPKTPPPPPFVSPMSPIIPVFGNGPLFCKLTVEQQGVTYDSSVLRLNTQRDGDNFCDYLLEPATFFLDQWSTEKNFNDTQAFKIIEDKDFLEIPPAAEGQPPVAQFTISYSPGYAPVTVTLDASTAFDPDGQIMKYEWDIDRKKQLFFGQRITTEFNPSTAAFRGEIRSYNVTLTVMDNQGLKESNTQAIKILEPPPQVTLISSQSVYQNGEQLQIQMPHASKRASYSDNYVEYVGVILPHGEIYNLTHQNVLIPFDGSALSPWQGEEQVVDLPVTSGIPKGLYQLYLVLVPKGIEPLSFRQYWVRGITTFTILDEGKG